MRLQMELHGIVFPVLQCRKLICPFSVAFLLLVNLLPVPQLSSGVNVRRQTRRQSVLDQRFRSTTSRISFLVDRTCLKAVKYGWLVRNSIFTKFDPGIPEIGDCSSIIQQSAVFRNEFRSFCDSTLSIAQTTAVLGLQDGFPLHYHFLTLPYIILSEAPVTQLYMFSRPI